MPQTELTAILKNLQLSSQANESASGIVPSSLKPATEEAGNSSRVAQPGSSTAVSCNPGTDVSVAKRGRGRPRKTESSKPADHRKKRITEEALPREPKDPAEAPPETKNSRLKTSALPATTSTSKAASEPK